MAFPGRDAVILPYQRFLKQFLTLVLLAWVIPPAFGMAFIVFVDILTIEEMWAILISWPMQLLLFGSFAFAAYYFHRFASPICRFLRSRDTSDLPAALARFKRFPLHFWGLFLLTLLLAPNLVVTIGNSLMDLQLQWVDWFRIHLVALIVSIVVGLPIFFLVIDLFGRALHRVALDQVHITLRAKVFLIGSLVPLLIDTMLVQYFWARTGYFTGETFIIWLVLELIAIAGSLLFVRSFGQSLAPLQSLIKQNVELSQLNLDELDSRSTDELGLLADEYRNLLEYHNQVEERLRRSEKELNNILFNMQDTFYRTDREGHLVYVTAMAEQSLGYSIEELLGSNMADLYQDPNGRSEFFRQLEANGGEIRNFVAALRHKDGSNVWASTNAHYYHDANGLIAGVEGNARDITQYMKAQEALAKEQQRALVALESIGDGVMTTDTSGVIDYLNPVAERLLDCSAEQAIGNHYMKVLKLLDESTGEALHDLVEIILQRDSAIVHADDGVFTHRDGSQFTINISAAPMRSKDDEIIGVVLVLHDITEVMGMAKQLSFQASHDMLTNLYNRREFEKRLDASIRSARNEDRHHVLLYMDLDQFKVVNDTSGHRAGDELLAQLSALLKYNVREHDILARLGGDEFGLLLIDCPLAEAADIAETIRQQVRDFRFAWENRIFDVGVSIGVVPITADGGNLIDIMSTADAACYVAKDAGRNRVHIFSVDDKAVARHHHEMEWTHRISQAFEENRFVLYFQQISSLNGKAETLPYGEVLMRMLDRDGRAIPPLAFIPAAERYNLMPTIDRWVVRTALGKMREAQGPAESPPLRFTINLSGQSLTDEHFLDFVLNQIHECDIAGEYICFEITETAAITNLSRARTFIATLKNLGCSFALDDFGSGLSSFGYLKGLQVDFIKIDGGFVKDMVNDRLDSAMVASINQIGHVMGLRTIAEFAESDDVVLALRRMGVDYAQGFAIAKPEPLDEVVIRLAHQSPGLSSSQLC